MHRIGTMVDPSSRIASMLDPFRVFENGIFDERAGPMHNDSDSAGVHLIVDNPRVGRLAKHG